MTNRDRMLTKIERIIERIIELEYDQLDRRLTNHEIDQAAYNKEAKLIDEWAREMYDRYE